MSEELEGRVAELEAELAQLEAQHELTRAADEALEVALRDRLPLERTLRSLLPILVEHTEALGAIVRTFDENLELRDFATPGTESSLPVAMADICLVTDRRRPFAHAGRGLTVLGQHLDVAGELFGAAVVTFQGELDDDAQAETRLLIDTWCEVLDNYLASIAESRRKHRIIQALSEALRDPVFNVGLDRAIAVLQDQVAFEDLLLVFRLEEDLTGASLHYKIIQQQELTHDSSIPRDIEIDEFIRTRATQMIRASARDLVEKLGMTRGREEVLIAGLRPGTILGRLVVTSAQGEFNTSDRDLVERFTDHLRQRIVDYNREWKHLSQSFPDAIVHRLLSEPGAVDRVKPPASREVVVLVAGLSDFTRVCEEELKDPALISSLLDLFSREATELIWDQGGVFDKLHGGRVTAIFGPPFHDVDRRTLCRRAAAAARAIRAHVRALSAEVPALRKLSSPPLGVGGLHIGRAVVGFFGPNQDFAGFGSGIELAGQLCERARPDELLCSPAFVAAHGDGAELGLPRPVDAGGVSLEARQLLGEHAPDPDHEEA